MGVLTNAVQNIFDPKGGAQRNKSFGDSIANSKNEDFRNSANKYQQTIDSNTGKSGYQTSYNQAKKDASELADKITSKQANGAASQAVGAAVSSGMTRGRAGADAAKQAGNMYANLYGQNYGNAFNNQQNAMNQQLANQLNAQGTLMGANLQNNQAEYQQAWGNVSNGEKANLGLSGLIGSDKRLKDSVKVGIDGDEDCRMARYKRAGEKLKKMNPNKWNELKWRSE